MKVRILLTILISTFLLLGLNQAFATNAFYTPKEQFLDCSGPQDVPQTECEALIALYNSTAGENWIDNSNWLTINESISVCDWFGITCDEGHVSDIDLQQNNLTGPISPELANLTNLATLELWENRLTGEIPTEIGALSNLRLLSLTSNQLEGQIPSSIGNLTQLRRILLGRNNLDGSIPSELGNLTILTELSLNHNQLSGPIPPELENLSFLTGIVLWENNLSGEIPEWIGNLSELYWLNLYANEFEGEIPASFGNLSSIYYLALGNNNLEGAIPPELGSLTTINILSLENNQLSGPIPPELSNLTSLDSLYINDNLLTGSIPTSFENITGLETLFLHNNLMAGSLPQELVNLDKLTKFRFFGTDLCEPGNDEFEAWLIEQERRGQPSDTDIQSTGIVCGQPAGKISGRLTDAQGNGLANIEVRALRVINDTYFIESTSTTDDSGNYQIEGLGKGIGFTIQFIDNSGENPSKYYDNVAEIQFATSVTTALGTETTNINSILGTPPTNFHSLNVEIEEPESNSGYVTSSPAGIDCSSDFSSSHDDCTETYSEDSVVTLTAITSSRNRFLDWSEPCSGQTQCTISMTEDITVTAIFTNPPPLYTVEIANNNGASITSDPIGISCGGFFINTCSENFRGGTTVTLTARVYDGFYFHNWLGDCAGSANPCVLEVDSPKSVSINAMDTPPTVTPTPLPTSTPVATPTPEETPVATIPPSATPNPPAETDFLIYLPAILR